ncbi:MAG: hypothetical protein HY738_13690 [Bacteroidia bacterium]|nr:hypothetical protein [Bacteroidia bacterium]
MEKKKKTFQKNNWKIKWSNVYEKWQVGYPDPLEEFCNLKDALSFAQNTTPPPCKKINEYKKVVIFINGSKLYTYVKKY